MCKRTSRATNFLAIFFGSNNFAEISRSEKRFILQKAKGERELGNLQAAGVGGRQDTQPIRGERGAVHRAAVAVVGAEGSAREGVPQLRARNPAVHY